MQFILIILFGWPSAILGLALLIIGIILKDKKIRFAGAILAMGFCLYTSLYPPPIRWIVLLSIAGNWSCAFSKDKTGKIIQALSIVPMISLMTLFGFLALT